MFFGSSNPLTVILGGGTILPPDMIGLQIFQIVAIPEPSIIALGVLSAAALLSHRRK
jgi:hypothetical protein